MRSTRLRPKTPDLLVLDLMLPHLDGLEICRRVRANEQTANIPIIMLTARAEESERIVGLELGADDYLAKPFSPNELVARVRALAAPRQPAGAGRERRSRTDQLLSTPSVTSCL
jgi:DNA-binding response OmpR family regulator